MKKEGFVIADGSQCSEEIWCNLQSCIKGLSLEEFKYFEAIRKVKGEDEVNRMITRYKELKKKMNRLHKQYAKYYRIDMYLFIFCFASVIFSYIYFPVAILLMFVMGIHLPLGIGLVIAPILFIIYKHNIRIDKLADRYIRVVEKLKNKIRLCIGL